MCSVLVWHQRQSAILKDVICSVIIHNAPRLMCVETMYVLLDLYTKCAKTIQCVICNEYVDTKKINSHL